MATAFARRIRNSPAPLTDLNYRINLPDEDVRTTLVTEPGALSTMASFDQVCQIVCHSRQCQTHTRDSSASQCVQKKLSMALPNIPSISLRKKPSTILSSKCHLILLRTYRFNASFMTDSLGYDMKLAPFITGPYVCAQP